MSVGADAISGRAAMLTPREQARLAAILARLASPFEGERAVAGLLANAFIEKHGLSWADLTIVQPALAQAPVRPAEPASSERRHALSRFA